MWSSQGLRDIMKCASLKSGSADCRYLKTASRCPHYWSARLVLLTTLLTMLLTGYVTADTVSYTITRPEWPKYANGHSVLALPAVYNVLTRFKEKRGVRITIQHFANASSRLWAIDLHNQLVSFGVPTHYLEIRPTATAFSQLVLTIIDQNTDSSIDSVQ